MGKRRRRVSQWDELLELADATRSTISIESPLSVTVVINIAARSFNVDLLLCTLHTIILSRDICK